MIRRKKKLRRGPKKRPKKLKKIFLTILEPRLLVLILKILMKLKKTIISRMGKTETVMSPSPNLMKLLLKAKRAKKIRKAQTLVAISLVAISGTVDR